MSHWKLTVLVHQIISLPFPFPINDYHVADLLRFVIFAGLNVLFGTHENKFTTDYKLYGWLTIANAGLALLLAARTNLFAILLRIPSPVLLQYHRWTGLATVAHGTVHFAYNIQHSRETGQIASSFVNKRIRIGIMAWISLAIIFLTALPFVRRRGFEVFYYAHACFFIFMVGALIHTTNGPEFMLPGFCLWVIDRFIRFAYNFRRIEVTSVKHYEGNVTKFKVKGIRTTHPGQVAWVQIPNVSFLNWHPFTIASAPGDVGGRATIAVRGLGGYTKNVQHAHDDYKREPSPSNDSHTALSLDLKIRMRLDGPYGVGRVQWGHLPVSVVVAGGIGITPGISIASHIVRKMTSRVPSSDGSPAMNLPRSYVHILWVVKDISHVQWFQQELQELYELSLQDDTPGKLQITIHATGNSGMASDSVGQDESYEMQVPKPTDLPWTINTGRPDIAGWMGQIKTAHSGLDAAVNICGPRTLITEARKAAIGASSSNGIFYVEEEVFEL